MAEYANIIVDISHEKLDKTFQYKIPEYLKDRIEVGMLVHIPFGSRKITGYVVELTDTAEYEESKIKELLSIDSTSVPIESRMIALAAWMRKNYGGTMNHALKTVIPVKEKKNQMEHRTVRLAVPGVEAKNLLGEYERKHYTARARLLRALLEQEAVDWELITHKLNVSGTVIKGLKQQGVVEVISKTRYRNPVEHLKREGYDKVLNPEQQQVVDTVMANLKEQNTWLLKGVTGSGKTEVYMELIAGVIAQGGQAIVLIPEIALTYQTVMRFYGRFGERVSIMNSRLSQGERYDQFERAKKGELDIMIGPRSALFTPFPNLRLIIIDEEHETSYKSETIPRYHARETAIKRAQMEGATVVLGSATPSVESYYAAETGKFKLLELKHRVSRRPLPECTVIDLREELKSGNRSILSVHLREKIKDRLDSGQQIMLFINRRGLAGFVSCRACGHVIKCPHCDVSLSQHGNGKMVCHYCGYEEIQPKLCPKCGSKYISGFKAGTERIEQVVKQTFPQARVLRMDFDTTRSKESYEQILSAFGNEEADILIGTQMIVKGHDFPGVTLVGVLAADMSLHVADYHSAERTFQLLTQAAGRAGRGDAPGEVVIQTYDPQHYSIAAAKKQDYEAFYRQEIAYREMLYYPPVWNMLVILCAAKTENAAGEAAAALYAQIEAAFGSRMGEKRMRIIGPADASIAKVNDIYKKVIYLKTPSYETLVAVKDGIEQFVHREHAFLNVTVQFDFNPVNGF
jgi:primosomal protein N' (replication factor Y)